MGCINGSGRERQYRDNNQRALGVQATQVRRTEQLAPVAAMKPSNGGETNQIYPPSISLAVENPQNHDEFIQQRGPLNSITEADPNEQLSQISQTLTQIQRRRERRANQPISIYSVRDHQIERDYELQILFYIFRRLRSQNNQQHSETNNALLFIRLLQILNSEPESHGLTQNQINRLEKVIATDGQKSCPVCQDEIKQGQQTMVLPCKHPFHPACIVPWLQKSDKCPMCRVTARKNVEPNVPQ